MKRRTLSRVYFHSTSKLIGKFPGLFNNTALRFSVKLKMDGFEDDKFLHTIDIYNIVIDARTKAHTKFVIKGF